MIYLQKASRGAFSACPRIDIRTTAFIPCPNKLLTADGIYRLDCLSFGAEVTGEQVAHCGFGAEAAKVGLVCCDFAAVARGFCIVWFRFGAETSKVCSACRLSFPVKAELCPADCNGDFNFCAEAPNIGFVCCDFCAEIKAARFPVVVGCETPQLSFLPPELPTGSASPPFPSLFRSLREKASRNRLKP